jgi:hypothetical protein
MATKRSRKQVEATEPAIAEATEAEVQPEAVEPQADVPEQIESQEDQAEQPRVRKCPAHTRWFAGEDEMRPWEEFAVNKTTGKLASTYCKRCNSKMHTEYGRRKRAEAAQSVERLQAIVDQKRAELAAAEEQLQYIMDLEHEAAEREAES